MYNPINTCDLKEKCTGCIRTQKILLIKVLYNNCTSIMYIKIKLTDVGLGKLYSTQGGRMRVLSKSLAKAREPRKWSAWFPNLPTNAMGVTIYRKVMTNSTNYLEPFSQEKLKFAGNSWYKSIKVTYM